MTMQLNSPAFQHQAEIPSKYTCEGSDISPPLTWTGIPEDTKSLVLIIDDPDAPDPAAPRMVWVHWILYNIPPATHTLAEAVKESDLPAGTLHGINDWRRTGYGGPCPPIGQHRYFHKLYALDTLLPDMKRPIRDQLENVMQGHIIEKAELLGYYKKH